MEPTGHPALDASLLEDPTGRQALKSKNLALPLAVFRPRTCLNRLHTGYECQQIVEVMTVLAVRIVQTSEDLAWRAEARQKYLEINWKDSRMCSSISSIRLLFENMPADFVRGFQLPRFDYNAWHKNEAWCSVELLHECGYRWGLPDLERLIDNWQWMDAKRLFNNYYLSQYYNPSSPIDMTGPEAPLWERLQKAVTHNPIDRRDVAHVVSYSHELEIYPLYADTTLLERVFYKNQLPAQLAYPGTRPMLSRLQLPPSPTKFLRELRPSGRKGVWWPMGVLIYQAWKERAAHPDSPGWFRERVAAITIGTIRTECESIDLTVEDFRQMRNAEIPWGRCGPLRVIDPIVWEEMRRSKNFRIDPKTTTSHGQWYPEFYVQYLPRDVHVLIEQML